MLVRKCDNCGREFRDGEMVYVAKRTKAKYVSFSPKGEATLEYTGSESNEEWCEICATAVNNALDRVIDAKLAKVDNGRILNEQMR